MSKLIENLKKAALEGYAVKISAGVWIESGARILEDCAEYPDKPDVIDDELYLITDNGGWGAFDNEDIERILMDDFDSARHIEIVCE